MSCHCMPSSNVYGEGYFFPWAICGIYYLNSCPYGPCFTSCPEKLWSSAWNECGRQWPERTSCSSHPYASSNSDGYVNNEFQEMYDKATGGAKKGKHVRRLLGEESNQALYGTEGSRFGTSEGGQLFFAPNQHVYDARLVEALYEFARQGAKLKSVKLFTTTILQLAMIGLNPPSSSHQHLGITLEFSKDVEYAGKKWHFLTLEMMSSGLMWQVTQEAPPAKDYAYQKEISMAYHDLSPRLVARYVADQRDRVYRTGSVDCQTFAVQLAQRLSLHGRSLLAVDGLGQRTAYAYLIEPSGASKLPALRAALTNMLRRRGVDLHLKAEPAVLRCPSAAPAWGPMGHAARLAWSACSEPLSLVPVTFQAP